MLKQPKNLLLIYFCHGLAILSLFNYLPANAEEANPLAKSNPAEIPANMTAQDQGHLLPASLIRGQVSNQTERYILGPGDTLSIKINDLEKFDQKISIRPDGYASIHPFGEFYLAGTDIQGLQTWLEEKFKEYLLKPRITINLDDMRPSVVYISGAVQRPGAYQFIRNYVTSTAPVTQSIDRSEVTLSSILARAGGVSIDADVRHIQVTHTSTGQKENYDLTALLGNGDTHDIWLMSEDAVNVPKMDHPLDPETFQLISQSTFFKEKFPVIVLGAVQHQGEVQLDPHDNYLNAAIGLAGGYISNYLSDRSSIVIQRPNNHGRYQRWMIDPRKNQFAMMPGDVVYVASSKNATLERGLQLLNAMIQPYFYTTAGTDNVRNIVNMGWSSATTGTGR